MHDASQMCKQRVLIIVPPPTQVSGFFKGMSYPIFAAGALNSIYFGVYGATLRSLTELRSNKELRRPPQPQSSLLLDTTISSSAKNDNDPTKIGGEGEKSKRRRSVSLTDVFLAGCAGGAAQLVVACPVDLVKIKLQTQTGTIMTKIYVNVLFMFLW